MPYDVHLRTNVRKELETAPPALRRRLANALVELSANPRQSRPGFDCKKLSGHDLWRVRVGHWRIVYAIDDAIRIVQITRVGPREGIYD